MVLAAVTNVVSLSVNDASQCAMFNRYLLAQAIGIPALVLGQQLFAFLSLENRTRRTMAAGIVCFAVNAVGDLLFTAVISLGTFGLGLASSISVWMFFIVQLLYYTSGRSFLKFSRKACNWKDAPEIMRRGYSGALSRFVEMFRCLLVNGLILKFVGTEGLSSFSASNSFLGVVWAVPFGMIAVERMLMSIALGEEDRESLLNAMRVMFRRCLPIMAGIAALIIVSAVPLTRMFYRNPAEPVYQMTVMGFRLLPFCMPLAVVSVGLFCPGLRWKRWPAMSSGTALPWGGSGRILWISV